LLACYNFFSFLRPTNKSPDPPSREAWKILLVDFLLVLQFILSHSLMTKRCTEWFWQGLSVFVGFQRFTYIVVTACSIQVLIRFWEPLPFILWNIPHLGWVFQSTFYFGIFACICGIFFHHPLELYGILQPIASIRQKPPPEHYFSQELSQLYSNMRHPILLGFIIVLLSSPIMTLDRGLLATMLILYAFVVGRTEEKDLVYMENKIDEYCLCSYEQSLFQRIFPLRKVEKNE